MTAIAIFAGRFAGRVAIVTGGSGAFGAAICRRLVAEGAQVTVADVNDAKGGALVTELGPNARYQHVDVAVAVQVEAMVADTVAAFGGLDILVNNAGLRTARSRCGS